MLPSVKKKINNNEQINRVSHICKSVHSLILNNMNKIFKKKGGGEVSILQTCGFL